MAYSCVISIEGGDNTYDGKTAGSNSWEVAATGNSRLGDTSSHDNNMHRGWLNVPYLTGIHNLLHEF